MSTAKILLCADMHGMTNIVSNYASAFADHYDATFILGDTEWFALREILAAAKTDRVYGILGNHDKWTLYDNYPVENIHGKCVSVNGVNFAGFQGSERYSGADRPMYTQEESRAVAKTIPAADVLLAHTSPYTGSHDPAHTGLIGIDDYIKAHHPKYVFHGHHHDDTESVSADGRTKIVGLYRVRPVIIRV